MISIEFPQANIPLAKDQPEYETLYVHVDPNDPTLSMTACFELSDEEIVELVKTRKLWYTQLTFGQPFQPVRMSTQNPFVQQPEEEASNG